MIPGQVPFKARDNVRIKPNLQFPPPVAADHAIGEEIALAEQEIHLAHDRFGLVRQDSISEEGVPFLGQMALHEDGSEAAVRKERKGVVILAHRVVAVTEIGMRKDVESPLNAGELAGFCPCDRQFK
jgi:hypothetical protein